MDTQSTRALQRARTARNTVTRQDWWEVLFYKQGRKKKNNAAEEAKEEMSHCSIAPCVSDPATEEQFGQFTHSQDGYKTGLKIEMGTSVRRMISTEMCTKMELEY